jgi:hypothetical protein
MIHPTLSRVTAARVRLERNADLQSAVSQNSVLRGWPAKRPQVFAMLNASVRTLQSRSA